MSTPDLAITPRRRYKDGGEPRRSLPLLKVLASATTCLRSGIRLVMRR